MLYFVWPFVNISYIVITVFFKNTNKDRENNTQKTRPPLKMGVYKTWLPLKWGYTKHDLHLKWGFTKHDLHLKWGFTKHDLHLKWGFTKHDLHLKWGFAKHDLHLKWGFTKHDLHLKWGFTKHDPHLKWGFTKHDPHLKWGFTEPPDTIYKYNMERSTSLQLNNSFLGFEIEYALCNRDKKLVFVLIHLSKLFQMQSEIVALSLNVSPPFLYFFFIILLNLFSSWICIQYFPRDLTSQQSINQSYIWSTLFFTLHNRCNIQEKVWRYRRRNQKP